MNYRKNGESKSLNYRKNGESKSPKVAWAKNPEIMLLSNCVVCNSKKSTFIKQREASRLLSSLAIKSPLSKTPLVGPLLFSKYSTSKCKV